MLDEPTTGVDVEAQEALAELLDRLHRELAVTILYVSHEFGAVERFVERLVLVRGGSSSTARRPSCRASGTTPRTSMLELEFMRLAFATGAVIGLLAPAVGFFLVQRRLSLIGDGIGHVAFAGVAAGYLLGMLARAHRARRRGRGAVAIEWLRARRHTAGDQALALVFYTGIAAGVVLVSLAGALDVDLFAFLFGSILTTTRTDLASSRCSAPPGSRRSRCSTARSPASRSTRRARASPACRSALLNVVVAVLAAVDGRPLDAHRRHPPDRGADGAAGDRRLALAWSMRSTLLLSMAIGLGSRASRA